MLYRKVLLSCYCRKINSSCIKKEANFLCLSEVFMLSYRNICKLITRSASEVHSASPESVCQQLIRVICGTDWAVAFWSSSVQIFKYNNVTHTLLKFKKIRDNIFGEFVVWHDSKWPFSIRLPPRKRKPFLNLLQVPCRST